MVIGSITPRPFYLGWNLGYWPNTRLGGPESQSGCSGEEKRCCMCLEPNHDSSVVQSVITVPTAAPHPPGASGCSVSFLERMSWFQRRIVHKSRKLRGETVLRNYCMNFWIKKLLASCNPVNFMLSLEVLLCSLAVGTWGCTFRECKMQLANYGVKSSSFKATNLNASCVLHLSAISSLWLHLKLICRWVINESSLIGYFPISVHAHKALVIWTPWNSSPVSTQDELIGGRTSDRHGQTICRSSCAFLMAFYTVGYFLDNVCCLNYWWQGRRNLLPSSKFQNNVIRQYFSMPRF